MDCSPKYKMLQSMGLQRVGHSNQTTKTIKFLESNEGEILWDLRWGKNFLANTKSMNHKIIKDKLDL